LLTKDLALAITESLLLISSLPVVLLGKAKAESISEKFKNASTGLQTIIRMVVKMLRRRKKILMMMMMIMMM